MSVSPTGKSPAPNRKILRFVIAFPIIMFALTFFTYPLYSAFCRITGYGGTPKVAEQLTAVSEGEIIPDKAEKADKPIGTKPLTVRFNADVDKNLPWKFYPEKLSVEVIPGKTATIFYVSENLSDERVFGRATYNVTPHRVGGFITKVECFCFTEQFLEPGETKRMAMTFTIDPEIEKDKFLKDMNALTFSYTFFKEDDPEG